MKNTLLCYTALAGICTLFSLSASTADPADDAKALFERMNNRFASLTSLSYTVNRETTSGKKSTNEKWNFRLKAPAMVKVEYYTPVHRHLVINENSIWEYIPAAKKALKTDLDAMPPDERTTTVMSTLAHVSVDGLRLGDYANMLTRVTSVITDDENITVVHGQNPKFVVHADSQKGTLVHFELYDEKDDLVMQTDASRFIKTDTDFWFPQDVSAIYRTDKGFIKSRSTISNIRVNESLDDALFLFNPPEGVQLMNN